MSLKPHNPWRARAARAGLALAFVASGAGALHATPAVPNVPSASAPVSQAPAPTAGSAATPVAAPRKRPARGKGGKVRTIASSSSAPAPAGRGDVVAHAMSQRGVSYRWGGESPAEGFDCSGLAHWAWGQVGVSIARDTWSIWRSLPRVTGPLQAGDLVFFGLGHMGIYIGRDRFVHAPQTGDVVKVTSMAPASHYGKRYSGAVRPG